VDYSQTVNKFPHLDAYPLPSMQNIVSNVANYKWYSSLDLQSAHRQVPLLSKERKFSAFEVNGRLYQFKRIPFGLKNAVACFQCVIDDIIATYDCKGLFAYLDDITVCGKTKEEHDKNLKIFLNAVKECNLTLNESKCMYASETTNLLGYRISKGVLQPDPDWVKPILDMLVPCNAEELQRMLEMFSHYAKWTHHYSENIKLLVVLKKFPLNEALHALKR